MKSQFTISARLKSLNHALSGIRYFLSTQHNAIIHTALTVVAVMAGIFFQVTRTDSLFLVFAMGLVWLTELLNTAIEAIMDFVHPGKHPRIKYIKDLAAAAVLVSAITALIIGLLIFLPYLLIKP